MPNYDYRCMNCKRRFEVFMAYADYGKQKVTCPHCQSENIQRKIGRVRIGHSEESRLDSYADPSMLEGLEDDPKALGRMMRQMSHELGEDMGPEFTEVVSRLEAGQSPDEIEASMPDLAGDESFGGDDF
jgi:putative FmdB family regulatory protein